MDASLSEIMVSIDELATRGRINRNRALAAWFAISFFDVDEDDALEAAAADGGNDQGIDLVFPDEASQEIVVVQAYCPDNFTKKTPKNKWDAAVASVPFVREPIELERVGRPDLSESISAFKNKYPEYGMAVGLVTLSLQSNEIDSSVRAHQKAKTNSGVTYFYSAQEDILAKYRLLITSEAGIPDEVIKFSGNHIEDRGDYGRAWIGSISASELQRLYKAYADKLFAGNIRLFLGARKGV